MRKQKGFTLVEVAIVMVIIGLLLGGVLKGREIITNAKIKKLENELNGTTAAIYSYQDRYQAFPGDDTSAEVRFKGIATKIAECPSGTGGSCGNGTIDNEFKDASETTESGVFWAHLRYADLINGITITPADAAQLPIHAFDGTMGVSHVAVTTVDLPQGLYVAFSNIPREIAITLESQTDDLAEGTGGVRGIPVEKSSNGTYSAITGYDMYFIL